LRFLSAVNFLSSIYLQASVMPSINLTQTIAQERDPKAVVCQATTGPDGIAGNFEPRVRLGEHFTYTTLDGDAAVLNTCVPVHTYIFDPAQFARFDYPATWPAGRPWPPRTIEDLCCAPDDYDWPCVGDQYLPANMCKDNLCKHTLTDWAAATKAWETYFELRETADRGIGVFAKQAFKELDILGWYAGVVTPYGIGTGTYALSLAIGESSSPRKTDTFRGFNLHLEPHDDHTEEEVTIEAQVHGNWTRFINHSCEPNTIFATRRVGQTRIMAVKAFKDITAGEELTIHYGETYFETRTCLCGAADCVEVA
jgi:hypothetical protein